MTVRLAPRLHLLAALCGLLLAACGGGGGSGPPAPPDGGDDTGAPDAGPVDAGPDAPGDTGVDTGPGPCATPDVDGDGAASEACGGDDCDDADATRHPGASDDVGDGVDQDCDGVDGVDADGDGYASEASGGGDCDDADATRNPGATDLIWAVELAADFPGTAGRFPSAVVGGDDVLHVAFRNGIGNLIHYGHNASGSWMDTLAVDTGVAGREQTSMAMGPDGSITLGFEGADGTFQVARRESDGTFSVESIPGTLYNSGARALAVDSAGHVHAVFYQTAGGANDLGYATDASGAWVVTTPDTTGNTGRDPSVVVDASGTVHVFYQNVTDESLVHAWNDGGGFSTEVVDDSDRTGRYSSPFVDGDGNLHVAMFSSSAGSLRYATDASGGWVTVTADGSGTTGFHPSLSVDADGVVHIAYYRLATGVDSDLYYATDASGAFVPELVDARFTGGAGHLAGVVDSTGTPHVFYPTGASSSVLRHAERVPDGIDQDCDGVDG